MEHDPTKHYCEKYLASLRSLTLDQRFDTARALYTSARELRAAAVRLQHPDWTEEQIATEVRAVFMYAAD